MTRIKFLETDKTSYLRYQEQQEAIDEIAEKLRITVYRPDYHGKLGDMNTVCSTCRRTLNTTMQSIKNLSIIRAAKPEILCRRRKGRFLRSIYTEILSGALQTAM